MTTPTTPTKPTQLSNVAKGVLQLVAALLSVVVTAFHLGLTPYTLTSLLLQFVQGFGTYVVPELPGTFAKRAKTWVAIAGLVLQAALAATSPLWGWHVSANDYVLVVIAALTVLATEVVPNSESGSVATILGDVQTFVTGGKHSAGAASTVTPAVPAVTATSSTDVSGTTTVHVSIPTVTPNP